MSGRVRRPLHSPNRTGPFDVNSCRVCGCTDELACPEGCWWFEADLFSSCADGEDPRGQLLHERLAEAERAALEASGDDNEWAGGSQ